MIAGSSFPDWMFLCGHEHDAGEVAHWPPFVDIFTQYINE